MPVAKGPRKLTSKKRPRLIWMIQIFWHALLDIYSQLILYMYTFIGYIK